MLSMIVTIDRNWAISNEHKPLITIPDDTKFIRDMTYGQVIICGRHTFEYTFNGKLLPNRTTIIVAKDADYKAKGAIVVQSSAEALAESIKLNKSTFVLGGKRLYNDLLPFCDEVHVTAVDYSYVADSYFPNLDRIPEWVMVEESEEQTHFDVVYYFRRYLRRKDYRV